MHCIHSKDIIHNCGKTQFRNYTPKGSINGKGKKESYMSAPIDFSKTKEDFEKEKIRAMEEKIKNRNKEIKKMLNKK